MKNTFKKIYTSEIFTSFIHKLFVILFGLNKFEVLDKENLALIDNDGPLIICFWHGRMFFTPFLPKNKNQIYTVVSKHTDGEMISKVVEKLGVNTIRGSSNRKKGNKTSKNRGGALAAREILEKLEQGKQVAITPDGPKGPAFIFKRNIFKLAQKSGVRVVNISFSATNAICFKSWDRFLLPMPFGKIVVKISGPFHIPDDISEEELEITGAKIESDLNSITREVDLICNRKPVN